MKELTERLGTANREIIRAIDSFPKEKRDEILFDEWSLTDILAHMTAWNELTVRQLEGLMSGEEPPWAKNIDEFNREGVERRKGKSWEIVYNEFVDVSERLINTYRRLPEDLWTKKFWPQRKFTPEKMIKIDINHYLKEHLPSIKAHSN